MLKHLLLLTLLCLGTWSACPLGCSKCVKEDSVEKCKICDLSRFYHLNSDGTCQQNELPNCQIPSPSVSSKLCVRCNDKHFFDELIQECVSVPDSKIDENCAIYSPVADCLRCNQGHIVQQGACVVPSNVIQNCLWQISEEHCETCKSGYQLNVSRSACLSFSTVNNCQQHQNFTCQRCKSDYTLAFNWHLLSKISLGNMESALAGELDLAVALDEAKEDCVHKSIDHCQVYDTYGRCETCASSYHVSPVDGKCVLSREPAIFKCKRYSNVSTCAECEQAFYLSGDKCVRRTLIPFCEKYTINSDGCDECMDGYYSASSSCNARNLSANIDHCDEYELKSDKCKKCEATFVLSTDQVKCFNAIPFCTGYNDTSSSQTLTCSGCEVESIPQMNTDPTPQIIGCTMRNNPGCISWDADNSNACAQCLPNYYWKNAGNNNLCERYTKECKTYLTDSDNCDTCFPGYFKNDSNPADVKCEPYTVKNCNQFVPGSDACLDCNAGYFKDTTTNDCHPYTLVNCMTPNPSENKCDGCDNGFYKTDDVTCLPNDLWECSVPGANNECTTCNNGFYLSGGKCFAGTIVGCQPSNYTSNANTCSTCDPGYYKDSSNICHKYTVSNCQGATNNGFVANEDKCSGCLPGFYLDTDGKCMRIMIPHCVAAGTSGSPCTTCADGYFVDGNGCSLQYIPFCKVYTSGLNECTTCFLGYNRVSASQCVKVEIPNCLTYVENGSTCDACQPGFGKANSDADCVALDTPGCTGYSNGVCNSFNASHYYKDGNNIIPKVSEYCIEPETSISSAANSCKTCSPGFTLISDGNTNKCSIPNITGCELFAADGTCALCAKNKWANAALCSDLTLRSNCLKYKTDANECEMCEVGFQINTTTGACDTHTGPHLTTLNCYGNTATGTGSQGCTTCAHGSHKISLANSFFMKKNPIGISLLNTDDTVNLLAPGFKRVSSKNIEASPESICLWSKKDLDTGNVTDVDIDAGFCKECRYPHKYWLDETTNDGTCTLRTGTEKCSVFEEKSNQCIACREGLAYAGSGNNTCTEAADTSTNCKYTKFNDTGCYECKTGFIVNSTAKTCAANDTSLVGCRVRNESTTTQCTECQEGWYLDKDDNICRKPSTCTLTNDNTLGDYCEYCLNGFKPHATSFYKCEPAMYEDGCSLYLNTNDSGNKFSVCAKCADPTMMPYNKFLTNSVEWKCVKRLYPEMEETYYQEKSGVTTIQVRPSTDHKFSAILPAEFNIDNVPAPTHICAPFTIENCMTYDMSNPIAPCTQCEDGYYLDANGFNGQNCIKGGIGGCLKYSARDDCQTCESGWKIVNESSKNYCAQYSKIDYCEIHSGTESACLSCAPGYLLKNKICVAMTYTNCKHFQPTDDICLSCEGGFYLKDGKCHAHSSRNCEQLSRIDDACLVCSPNYYLKAGQCYMNTSINCTNLSTNHNICLSCEDGYYLDLATSLCLGIEATNCLIPDIESGECLVCEDGFFYTSGQCNPHTIQNCLVFDTEADKCEVCKEGFFKNIYGVCEQYMLKNCRLKDPNGNHCFECKAGFYLDSSNQCLAYTAENCNVYSDYSNDCISCLPGNFKNEKNWCVEYSNIDNCAVPDPSRDQCINCNAGYYNKLGKCMSYSVQNCGLYKPDENVCMTCKEGYFILGTTCAAYTVRCEQYNMTSNTCLTCPEGYYLDDGICYVNNGLFCKEWSPFQNGCKSCVDGFWLDKAKRQCRLREHSNNCKETVETGDICLSCFSTHYMAGGKCIAYSRATCKKFDEKKDLCMECETNKYWMSHHVCEEYTVEHCEVYSPTSDECTQCEVGMRYLENGKCKESTKVEDCDKYSISVDACAMCDDGYYLASSSECRRNPSGLFKCIQYKDENTCVKCELGFYIDNNYCQKSKTIIDNCANYSGDGVCEMCNSTHLMIQNACVEKVETSCATWTDAENCNECPSNKVLKDNDDGKKVCEDSELSGCVKAEFATPTNKCLECGDKKILVNDACQDPVSPLAGCKTYVKEGECSDCDDGYTLTKSRNGCVSNFELMSENCTYGVEQDSQVCRVCMSGYHLDANRDCVSCGGDGCDVCDPYDSTKCIFCKPGYDHDGGACTQSATNKVVSRVVADEGEDDDNSLGNLKCFSALLFALVALIRF